MDQVTPARILELDPTVRMMCGGTLLAGVLADTSCVPGMTATACLAGAALLLHRRDPMRLLGLILAGSVMYLPALFWTPAGVAIKGLSVAIVPATAVTALSAQETSTVVMRLPLPVFIRFLLLQVLIKTASWT